MNYGIPYMGSKSNICKNICALFPSADHFYDLFGGGFSISHFMLEHRSKDYKHFHFNEIRPGICELIKDAIAGKYSYDNFKPRWISREEFFEKKELNPYIKMCWSFGNNGKDYLFSKDIEQYKKSMHNALIFNDFDDLAKKTLGMDKFKDGYSISERRLFLRNKAIVNNNNLSRGELETFQQLEQLQQLQQLERLQRLQQLEQLQRLEQMDKLNFYNLSYEQIEIKPNSTIYCDIPYKGTGEYDKNKLFNREKFLSWADQQTNPVFISEYQINDGRFKEIYKISKRSIMCGGVKDKIKSIEKVYVNKAGLVKLIQLNNQKIGLK